MNVMSRQVPPGKKPLALVMQGGGALGAYEWGAVTRLCEDGFHPVAVAGVSIGAVNAAAIAGAPDGNIPASLEKLWRRLMIPTPWFVPDIVAETWSAFGNPAMYKLRSDYFSLMSWTSLCEVTPLRRTLKDLCDFGKINDTNHMRFAVTATEVATGQLRRFLNTETLITPDHVLASGALPPGFPMAVVEGKAYWDGGVFDNTPVRPMFEMLSDAEADDLPIVLINLFPDATIEPIPTNMMQLKNRLMELTYENRFWADYGSPEGLREYSKMIAELDNEVPADSAIRRDRHFPELLKRRCLKNLHVINSEHVPMTGGMDFSEKSMWARYERGHTAADTYLKGGNLVVEPAHAA
ncbi:MAG: patatin-like phospholipase family protein [Rhodopila sp.]